MSTMPAASYMTNASRTEGEFKAALELFLAGTKEQPGGAAQSELTISSGSVTATAALHTIDTEGDAASDDLDNIAVTNHPAGRLLIISVANASRVVTVSHGAGGSGQILLRGSADLDLDDTTKHLVLKLVGTSWEEIGRLGLFTESVVKHYPIPAGAMRSCTTNGAEASKREYTTNDIDLDVFLFDSGATEERVQFDFRMPSAWNRGTIKARIYWDGDTGASVSDTVQWGIKFLSLSHNDAIDAAMGTPQVIAATLEAVGDMHITDPTPAITMGGSPALNDWVVGEIYRDTDGTDAMAEDAILIGAVIEVTEDQAVVVWT